MNASPGEVKLEARGISFSYTRPVVSDVSIRLRAGTLTGVVGPNGSGKTTLLRLLDGILKPEAGQVMLDGSRDLSRMRRKDVARRVAMVPQNGGGYYAQTVFEFAMQGRSPHLSLLGFESDADEEITVNALEMTRLTQYRDEPVSAISGGEKQRLMLARALIQQPEVLLLDELTANLDINFQVELLRLVRRITREKRLATLVVSHEINLISGFSDHIVLMLDGRVLQQGAVSDTVTPGNLKRMFGMNFTVRALAGGVPEVLPVLNEEMRNDEPTR